MFNFPAMMGGMGGRRSKNDSPMMGQQPAMEGQAEPNQQGGGGIGRFLPRLRTPNTNTPPFVPSGNAGQFNMPKMFGGGVDINAGSPQNMGQSMGQGPTYSDIVRSGRGGINPGGMYSPGPIMQAPDSGGPNLMNNSQQFGDPSMMRNRGMNRIGGGGGGFSRGGFGGFRL